MRAQTPGQGLHMGLVEQIHVAAGDGMHDELVADEVLPRQTRILQHVEAVRLIAGDELRDAAMKFPRHVFGHGPGVCEIHLGQRLLVDEIMAQRGAPEPARFDLAKKETSNGCRIQYQQDCCAFACASALRTSSMVSPNEARAFENLNSREGGDRFARKEVFQRRELIAVQQFDRVGSPDYESHDDNSKAPFHPVLQG